MPHLDDFDLEYNAELDRRAAQMDLQEQATIAAEIRQEQQQAEQAQAAEAATSETASDPETQGQEFDVSIEEDDGEEGPGFLGTLSDIAGAFSEGGRRLGGALGEAREDVLGGAEEAAKAVGSGVEDALVNTAQAGLDLGAFLGAPEVDAADVVEQLGIGFDEPETGTGQFAKATTQFLTGFIPALGAMRLLGGVAKVSSALATVAKVPGVGAALTGQAARFAAAGAVADFHVFDPHEARFADLLTDLGVDLGPVTDYLRADPEDSAVEGRLKNVLEGVGLGLIVDGAFRGLSRARSLRRISNTATDADAVPAQVMQPVKAVHDRVLHERTQMDHLVTIRNQLQELVEERGDETVAEARAFLANTAETSRAFQNFPPRPGAQALTERGELLGLDVAVVEGGDRSIPRGSQNFPPRPEAQALIEGAELRGLAFEDSVRDLDAAARSESTIAQLELVDPEITAKIRSGTSDLRVSINEQIATARHSLRQAEEGLFELRQTDAYAELPPAARKELEDTVDAKAYCRHG